MCTDWASANNECLLITLAVFIAINMIFAAAFLGVSPIVLGFFQRMSIGTLLQTNDVRVVPIAMIVLALGVILGATVGCSYIVKERKFILRSYMVFMAITFVLLLAMGVFAILQVQDLDGSKSKRIGDMLDQHVENSTNDTFWKQVFDNLQSDLRCCGSNNASDYKPKNDFVPASCCRFPEAENNCNISVAFKTGCKWLVFGAVQRFITRVGITAIVFAVFVLAAIGIAIIVLQ